MAPGVSSVPADRLRAQILENCSFFSELYARFWLIVSKEPLGDFKAIVVRAVDGNREAVLSEKAPSYQDALQALFVKSAEAVQNYIATNGFAVVSSIGKQTPKHTGGHDGGDESDTDSSSTVTLSECESLSDDETVSVTSVGRLKKRRGRKADKSGKTASSTKAKSRQPRARARSPSVPTARARSRSSSSSSSDEELHYNPPTLPSPYTPHGGVGCRTLPPRAIPTTHWPLPKASSASTAGHPSPPPPPPPQSTSAGANPSSGSGTTPARPPPPSFITLKPSVAARPSEPMLCPPHPAARYNHNDSPPSNGTSQTGNVVTQAPSMPPLRDVILEVRWRDQGERRVLLFHQMRHISLDGIRDAALAEVRRQPSTWINASGQAPESISPLGSFALGLRLKATVKAMVLDGMEYGLTGWAGKDLTHLVGVLSRGTTRNSPASGGGPPKFEVEVWEDNCSTLGHGSMTTALTPLHESTLPAARSGPWVVGGRGPSAQKSMQQPGPPRVDSVWPHNFY